MAIKVNGTVVVDDNRCISNICTVNATNVCATVFCGTLYGDGTNITGISAGSNHTYCESITAGDWVALNSPAGVVKVTGTVDTDICSPLSVSGYDCCTTSFCSRCFSSIPAFSIICATANTGAIFGGLYTVYTCTFDDGYTSCYMTRPGLIFMQVCDWKTTGACSYNPGTAPIFHCYCIFGIGTCCQSCNICPILSHFDQSSCKMFFIMKANNCCCCSAIRGGVVCLSNTNSNFTITGNSYQTSTEFPFYGSQSSFIGDAAIGYTNDGYFFMASRCNGFSCTWGIIKNLCTIASGTNWCIICTHASGSIFDQPNCPGIRVNFNTNAQGYFLAISKPCEAPGFSGGGWTCATNVCCSSYAINVICLSGDYSYCRRSNNSFRTLAGCCAIQCAVTDGVSYGGINCVAHISWDCACANTIFVYDRYPNSGTSCTGNTVVNFFCWCQPLCCIFWKCRTFGWCETIPATKKQILRTGLVCCCSADFTTTTILGCSCAGTISPKTREISSTRHTHVTGQQFEGYAVSYIPCNGCLCDLQVCAFCHCNSNNDDFYNRCVWLNVNNSQSGYDSCLCLIGNPLQIFGTGGASNWSSYGFGDYCCGISIVPYRNGAVLYPFYKENINNYSQQAVSNYGNFFGVASRTGSAGCCFRIFTNGEITSNVFCCLTQGVTYDPTVSTCNFSSVKIKGSLCASYSFLGCGASPACGSAGPMRSIAVDATRMMVRIGCRVC